MKYLKNYSIFYDKKYQNNESMKSWLSTFLIMANLGLVPLSVKSSNGDEKKEFIESQSQDKIDAVLFYEYLMNNGKGQSIDSIWSDFISKNDSVKSSIEEVKAYISQDGKNYYFDKDYQEYDFSTVDINKFTPVNWMTDMGNFIPDHKEPIINNWISEYEKKTSIEIGIITVKTLEGTTIEDYAYEQFNRLGIGKNGADNGVLIVVSMDDRKSRIETGYGMEAFLPDAKCNRILQEQIRSNFKKGDYYNGILSALIEMKNFMGEEAYSEKVRWLKEKQEKEDREAKIRQGEFVDVLLMGLFVSLILGTIGYIVYKKRKDKKTREKIDSMISSLKTILGEYPKSATIDSKYLKAQLDVLINSMDSVENQFKSINPESKSKDEVLENLSNLKNLADTYIKDYESRLNQLKNKISSINNSSQFINNSLREVDKAIFSYKEIKKYGYDSLESPDRSDIESLIPISLLAASLLSSDIDKAVREYDKFKSGMDNILDKTNKVGSRLNSIELAKSNVNKSDAIIAKELEEMNEYEKWAEEDEKKKIDLEVDNFNGVKSSLKTDYLKIDSELSKLVKSIELMKSKWYSRKKAYEDEQNRIRRKREDDERRSRESRSSYSGGGGGSFGGFGGGRSGGGGASGSF